jgi:chromosome segregation ATPase
VDFGLRIGIQGEQEFRKALADINQSFRVLGSEMQLVSSQYDKNDKSTAALAAKSGVLNKEIEAQKEKITMLQAALRNSSESFGDNDRRTQNWQIALNKAQAELNGMKRELEESGKAADNAGGHFEKVMQRAADMAAVMGIDMSVALEAVPGAANANIP